MRRIITVVSAVALTLGLLTGVAAASDDPVLEQLEQDIEDAQALVNELTTLVAGLEADLIVAETELQQAKDDYNEQELVVDGLQTEHDLAEAALNTAIAHRNALQAQYDACNPATSGQNNGNGCRNDLLTPGGQGPLADARADVVAAQAEFDEALAELNEAKKELGQLGDIVDDKKETVDGLMEDIAEAKSDLESAKDDLDAAVRARDEYLAAQTPIRQQGCNGIENAVVQVTTKGNGKGKAAEVLAKKADDWNCAA
jgi:chromosome segregation ATPase